MPNLYGLDLSGLANGDKYFNFLENCWGSEVEQLLVLGNANYGVNEEE